MYPTANERVSAFSSLEYFKALIEGSVARSSMLELFDVGRQMAIGEGRLLDARGRLLAHGTTTLPRRAARSFLSKIHKLPTVR
jgi:acyl-coenzyme A thioesterase PaaI-like protein